MRVLIGTNHFRDLAGSELVALEIAEHFRGIGAQVEIYANIAGSPIASQAAESGIPVVTDPRLVKPLTFDIVYFQHQIGCLFQYQEDNQDKESSLFVLGRLSTSEFLESSGWDHEAILGDAYLTNSAEAAAHVALNGAQLPIYTLENAAPDVFHQINPETSSDRSLENILLISNRQCDELQAAMTLLGAEGIECTHFGMTGEHIERIVPSTLAKHDLVITFGKSVQYCLASGTPVYVYGMFGGPGYLNEENFELAAAYNFSGRCCGRRLTPQQIVAAVKAGYGDNVMFSRGLTERASRWHLPTHLKFLAGLPRSSNAERRRRMGSNLSAFIRERRLQQFLRTQALSKIARNNAGK